MKKSILIAGAMLVFGASMASAQGGINLSWNDCGLAGTENATFLCNTNSGLNSAIASFIPPATLPEYLGLESQIDIRSQNPALPEWWKHGSGFCRGTTGLGVSFDFTAGPFGPCIDFFSGAAAGGFVYEYPTSPSNGDRARVRIVCAVPFDNRGQVDAGVEYYAYKLNLLRSKTTGTGNCAGCTEPVCIVLDNIKLAQPPEQANDPLISSPADRNYVTWQGADPTCPASTPTVNKTWGQVKSLYR